MSLQYLKKKVIDEVDFLHADKHQRFGIIVFDGNDQTCPKHQKYAVRDVLAISCEKNIFSLFFACR